MGEEENKEHGVTEWFLAWVFIIGVGSVYVAKDKWGDSVATYAGIGVAAFLVIMFILAGIFHRLVGSHERTNARFIDGMVEMSKQQRQARSYMPVEIVQEPIEVLEVTATREDLDLLRLKGARWVRVDGEKLLQTANGLYRVHILEAPKAAPVHIEYAEPEPYHARLHNPERRALAAGDQVVEADFKLLD